MDMILQCIAAFVGCLGFAFIFRIHHHMKLAFLAALNGMIATIVYLLFQFTNNIYFQNFMGMFIVALISEFLARRFKAPATIFITVGCFPLVPGKGIYMTMLYALQGYNNMFIESFVSTVGIAMSLALAILVASTVILIYRNLKTHPDVFFKEPFE